MADHPNKRMIPERKPKFTAAMLGRFLVGACAECGVSGAEATLYTIPDDHLTFFSGTELCGDCAPLHGVL